jgi:hypothetical protein
LAIVSAPIIWWAICHLLQQLLAEMKAGLQAEMKAGLAEMKAGLQAELRQQQGDLRADVRQLAERLVTMEQQLRSVQVTGPARPTGTSAAERADMRGAVWGSGADSDSARGSGDGSGAGPSGGHEAKA